MDYSSFKGEQRVHVDDLLKERIKKGKYIVGPAGSGKTEIICYCAEELAARGKKVLIAFFNMSLTRYCTVKSPHVTCSHYHQVPAIRKGLGWSWDKDFKDPAGVSLAECYLKPEYDYIFVDEAQDYKPNWFKNLYGLLKPEGIFVVSADPYQSLYGRHLVPDNNPDYPNFLVPSLTGLGLGFNGRWAHLNRIYRSNSLIQEMAGEFAKKHLKDTYGSHDFIFGKEREESEIHLVEDLSGGLGDKAVNLVRWLMRSGKDLNRTVIITHTEKSVATIYRCLKEEGFIYDDRREAKNATHCYDNYDFSKNRECKANFDITVPGVKVATIHSFKGLDIDNVILLFSEGEQKRVTDETLYTALTRAKKNLYIINPGDVSSDLRRKLYDIYGDFEEKPEVVTNPTDFRKFF